MSTLTDFDSITNQNVIAGLRNVPTQCMVVDGSSMFAGNASLPCAPPPFGSGQLEGALFEQAMQYSAAAVSVPATPHAPYHSSVLPNYSPSPSGNNNSRNNHDSSISSHFDEGCSIDDDEDSSILSNLPNSCHDFELKELHIRLERNHSSPLIGGHSSPALSSRLSSTCPSTEPPADPAEPEDLEVQFINECFEEQQRQSQMYQSGDLKTLFYRGSTELVSSKSANRPGTEKSEQSSLESPKRLPYAKKLSSQEPLQFAAHYDSNSVTSPAFLNLGDSFDPLLTPKAEVLFQNRALKESKSIPSYRRVSEPLTQKPSFPWDSGTTSSNNELALSSACCEEQTEALAKGVIESLFSGVPDTPLSEAKLEETPKSLDSKPNKAVRKLCIDESASLGSQEDSKLDLKRASSNSALIDAVTPEPSPKSLDSAPPKEGISANDDDVGDSWEDLDDSKLEQQLRALKLEVASKASMRSNRLSTTSKENAASWDPFFLPHVLEAYDVPEYKLAEDVVNALAATDWGNATVKWFERKVVFVVFANERQAREALVLHKHQWLRLRPLSKSPARVQEKAREIQAHLKPARARPKTNVGVARRMVENTLGMRSSISREQRDAERKQLSNAQAAKKNSVRWDD